MGFCGIKNVGLTFVSGGKHKKKHDLMYKTCIHCQDHEISATDGRLSQDVRLSLSSLMSYVFF
jgi:hypothetical protein